MCQVKISFSFPKTVKEPPRPRESVAHKRIAMLRVNLAPFETEKSAWRSGMLCQ
jgi:hypothetical protein